MTRKCHRVLWGGQSYVLFLANPHSSEHQQIMWKEEGRVTGRLLSEDVECAWVSYIEVWHTLCVLFVCEPGRPGWERGTSWSWKQHVDFQSVPRLPSLDNTPFNVLNTPDDPDTIGNLEGAVQGTRECHPQKQSMWRKGTVTETIGLIWFQQWYMESGMKTVFGGQQQPGSD